MNNKIGRNKRKLNKCITLKYEWVLEDYYGHIQSIESMNMKTKQTTKTRL